ncbi:MAG: M56 family metallopeptidase, partial [Planctomycetota bacterium]
MSSALEQLSPVFNWLTTTTVQASVLIVLILVLQQLLRRKLEARWLCWLWIILLIRMVLPWAPQSRISVFNLIPQPPEQTQPASIAHEDQSIPESIYPRPAHIPANELTTIPIVVAEEKAPEPLPATTHIPQEITKQPTIHTAYQVADVWPLIWLAGVAVMAVVA